MVSLNSICLSALGIASVLTLVPSRVEACKRPDRLGRVKSVIETWALVDSTTSKVGEARLANRIDVSKDGGVAEMTLYGPELAEPSSKFTTYFESGRPVRQLETVNGKTVSTRNCSYDAQGRLVEARTEGNGELNIVETHEYGSGFIRRRSRVFGSWQVANQTLDALGRVVNEVILDEATSTVLQTVDFTYADDREERCSVSSRNPRRQCSTTVRDSHGNEIEVRAEGQTIKTSFEYDSVGNWVSKRTSDVLAGGASVETIIRRKIEYW